MFAAGTFIIVCAQAAAGVTLTAKSPSFMDVKSVVSSGSDGDTVIIPAGTASWAATLTISKAITLKGATAVSGTHDNPVISDNTVILDDVPRVNNVARIITYTLTAGKAGRISGITFRKGSITQKADNGGVALSGTSDQFRMDHCHFDHLYQTDPVIVYGKLYGVIDHCVFDEGGPGHPFTQAILFNNGGTIDPYGDEVWTETAGFGTNKFMFVEDCTFNNGSPEANAGNCLDSSAGGKYVARYCTLNNCVTLTHGTETRQRSSRAIEIYNNNFVSAPGYSPTGGQIRGGTALIHDNTYTNFRSGMGLRCYREWNNLSAWPPANGSSNWDVNDPHGIYLSGTVAGVTNGSTTLTDTTQSWPPNQWAGYSIRNLTQNWSSYIQSNTARTISYVSSSKENVPYSNNNGEKYQIWRVITALDQPGRGKGDLITGDAPAQVNAMTRTAAWPNQALEPIYSWNNNIKISSYGEPTIEEGRDFYNNTPMLGYTPYTYPHPLTTGLFPSPPMTRNATPGSQDDLHKKKKQWAKKLEGKKAKKAKENSTNEMSEGQENLGE
jgi:hypothetical protein